jgi:two-component system response regulator VanR
MRVLIVEDEPFMAEAIRDGLRLDAIAADIAVTVTPLWSC